MAQSDASADLCEIMDARGQDRYKDDWNGKEVVSHNRTTGYHGMTTRAV